MNAQACQQALDGMGSGVAASLYAVDCAASSTAHVSATMSRVFRLRDGSIEFAVWRSAPGSADVRRRWNA